MARLYRLYYCPNLPLEGLEASHAGNPPATIPAIAADIAQRGMINPLFVTQYGSRLAVHPGKQRVAALKLLGRHTARAVIYSPEGNVAPREGWVSVSPEKAASLFSGDAVAEYHDERSFAVKKRKRR